MIDPFRIVASFLSCCAISVASYYYIAGMMLDQIERDLKDKKDADS